MFGIITIIVIAVMAFVAFKIENKANKQDTDDNGALTAFAQKVDEFLADDIIDRGEERELKEYINANNLSVHPGFQDSKGYHKLIQALVLRDIKEERDFERIHIDDLPILLGKSERVLWMYNNIDGYERKTGSKFTAGSSGVSLKICKGVYYRVGASKGQSTPYEYEKELGSGELILTNKAIYFIGRSQVKINYAKILSFNPYNDGITIVKDGANPKPYTFVNLDPWFVINAMQLLAE